MSDSVVIRKHGQKFKFSGNFKTAVFESKVKKYDIKGKVANAFDDVNEYKFNNYGHRGPDFRSGIDILAAGCSQTFGVGVSEEATWPALLAKELDMSYVNLSAPGASIEWIVQSLFSYFNEFGHPKVLALLLPDLFRMEVVINSDINTTRDMSWKDLATQGMEEDFKRGVLTCKSLELDLNWRAKISKRPFHIEDTIPPEQAIYTSFKHIMMLEQYCRATGIKLMWTSWSDDINWFIERYAEKNYFDYHFECLGLHFWSSDGIEEELEVVYKIEHREDNEDCPSQNTSDACICYVEGCHAELQEKYPDTFNYGADRHKVGVGNSHLGVHKHAHVADSFAQQIRNVIDSDK